MCDSSFPRTTDAGESTLNFKLVYNGQTDGACSRMSVDSLQLYFEDNLQDAISSVTLGGVNMPYTVEYLAAYPYLDVSACGFIQEGDSGVETALEKGQQLPGSAQEVATSTRLWH